LIFIDLDMDALCLL